MNKEIGKYPLRVNNDRKYFLKGGEKDEKVMHVFCNDAYFRPSDCCCWKAEYKTDRT